jgi:RNA polymerase subunit RPABC4/transcription elongation factor Spt4
MNAKCVQCGAAETLYSFGKQQLCMTCLTAKANKSEVCPNCGHTIKDKDWVGIQLNWINKSSTQKKAKVEALAIVCPKCHILFFDTFQYEVIQGLKEK